MIKNLQKRFIRIALTALAAAMVLVVLVINTANRVIVNRELQETLSFLAENSDVGDTPGRNAAGKGRMTGKNRHARSLISESSWFSVQYGGNGNQGNMNLTHMTDPDEQTASSLAAEALQSSRKTGFLQDFLYLVKDRADGGKTIFFLDCETRLAGLRTLALLSAMACLGGILLAFLSVSLASRRAIAPIIRNMEQQKQFITNASHELKTPLTVISTNMELLQMEVPGNQWVGSTLKQTAQMRHLVDELVYLSRMEEENAPMTRESLHLDDLIRETAEPFIAMAEYQGKEMKVDVEDRLRIRGDREAVRRLLSTLFDNAVKYSSAEGHILAAAAADSRNVILRVSNDVPEKLTREQCRQLFDRFYRADPSRSKEKQNGFGIGLAIAAAIVEKHGGSISAGMETDDRLLITCSLPGERTTASAK